MIKSLIGIFSIVILFGSTGFSQSFLDSISENNIKQNLAVLASDSLKGRGNGTSEILKAGQFIANKFKEAGLKPLLGQPDYFIPFSFDKEKEGNIPQQLEWNGKSVSVDRFVFFTAQPGKFKTKNINDFSIIHIDAPFTEQVLKLYDTASSDILLWSSKKQQGDSSLLPEIFYPPVGGIHHNFLLVYAEEPPDSITFSAVDSYYSAIGYNVIGMLPGKAKANEVIVFSSHYDHVGIIDNSPHDSIMNGANDNASGTTAILELAKYFSLKAVNERTIIFCAFSGEEIGLLGSRDFVGYIKPETIIADINIEMIGVPAYGKKSVFITGYDYSSLPAMLKKKLKIAGIRLRKEPDELRGLFWRSDNYSFALRGIPAHSIMSSDDFDPCYHKPCDEVRRINIVNMTNIIKAIAIASESLVMGTETPTRINEKRLN
jgi:hypothetical protein